MTEAELAGQIEPLLSETMQVKTAAAQASDDSADTQEGLNIIKYFLLGFGGIALFVGSFVIANTLAITVAQRMRELATLRTLGASRRQVLGSVILESLAVGLVGSVIGLFLGLGIAVGLMSLLESLGIDLPSGGLVFSVRTIVVSLGVGTLIARAGEPPARGAGDARSSRSRRCARERSCRRRASRAMQCRCPPRSASSRSRCSHTVSSRAVSTSSCE